MKCHRLQRVYTVVAVSLVLILTAGCGTKITVLKKRAPIDKTYASTLPPDIVFAVFPFNDYLPQIEFASSVQNVLLQAGLSVIEPSRGKKAVEERKGVGLEQSGGVTDVSTAALKRAEAQAVVIEKYTVSEDVMADYLVFTMRSDIDGTIKIIRKSDRKVIGVVKVYADDFGRELMQYFEKLKFVSQIKGAEQQ